MPRLRIVDLPFALAQHAADDGLHADTHADGGVARVYLQRGGRVVAAVRFDQGAASGETIERHESIDDDGDETDGPPAWIDAALRDLSRRADGIRSCAFCEKTSAEVAKLIMGPRQGICNECIALCSDILAAEAPAAG